MEEKLIEAVRIRQVLYDTSHVDYMRSKLKAEKWEEIAKEIDMKSGAEAKVLWEKLRHALRDAIRRKQKYFKNGTPTQAIKEWKFKKQMGFLQPYMVNKSREGNFRDTDTVEELNMQQQNESTEYEAQSQKLPETLPSTSAATSSSAATPKSAKKIKKDVAALLKNTTEKREERAKSRTKDRKDMLLAWNLTQNDPLFHLFMSMYQSTKKMPPASQHIVKSRVFNVVTEVEATLLNIPTYEQFTPVHQKSETYSLSSCNDHASTPSYKSNSTPAATPSYSSNSDSEI